jgi:cell division protein FtsN
VGKFQPNSFYALEKSAPTFGAEKSGQEKDRAEQALEGMLKKSGASASGPRVAELPAPKSTEKPAAIVPPGVSAPVNAPATVAGAPATGAPVTARPASSAQPVAVAKTASEAQAPVEKGQAPAPLDKAAPAQQPAATASAPPPSAPGADKKDVNAPAAKTPEVTVKPPDAATPAKEVQVVDAAPVEKAGAQKPDAPKADPAAATAKTDPAKVEKPAPAVPASAKGGAAQSGRFVIQVASFSGKDKRSTADVCKTRLERNAGIKAEILGTDADEYLRVVIGDYGDKESAQKACAELRQRRDFAQCFVRAR